MKRRLVVVLLAVFGFGFAAAGSALAAGPPVPVPNVTGPIAVTPDSYPFLATDIDLSKYGYVEEEYFLDGNGYTYNTTGPVDQTATRNETGGPNSDGTYPFKTRIVVRRPANPADANGTVVAEWYNVTAFRDIEWNWFGDPDYMLRNGYTFVGVTAQKVGADGLKAFNPTRYGTLNVSTPDENPSAPYKDSLSYDIYGAALNAIKGNRASGPDPIGGITPETVIASGESQSCSRLSTHYNKVEPLQNIADAYLLTVCGSQLRTDRPEKAIRIVTETENRTQFPTDTYPDTGSLRHWESAGGSHLPRLAWDNVAPLLNRDFLAITVGCQKFPLSLVQWPFTVNRAIKGLVDWVQDGTAPPIAPRGTYIDNPNFNPANPPGPSNPLKVLERDEYGIAQGGIRYPEMTVPTGVNDGINSAGSGGNPLFSAFCGLLGSNTLFDRATLDSRYTDYADYVSQYSDAVDEFLASDFILAEDAPRLKAISRQFPELRPTAPMKAGSRVNRGTFSLNWVGTEAPDTTFALQRQSSRNGATWGGVNATVNGQVAQLRNEPQGTFAYRVRSTTIIPANNIADATTTTTPFSSPSVRVKVDRTGPPAPRIVVQGRRIGRNAFRGPVRVRVVGRADGRLPDGSAGAGLNPRSVPRTRVIRKRGRSVIRVQTRDRVGNRSRPARLVIRIR
jgi:hypothetical protein